MFKKSFVLTLTLLIAGTSNAMTDGKDSKLATHDLLYLAKNSNHEALARALTEIKAAIDVSNVSDQDRKIEFAAKIDQSDGDGFTPLHWAAAYGHEKCVELLVRAGAEIDMPDGGHGWTPLHAAVMNGYEKCVELLIKAKAQLDLPDTDGQTPLKLAVWQSHAKCVVALLLYGAYATKLNAQNKSGRIYEPEVIAAFDTTPNNYIPTTKAALPAVVTSSLEQPLPPVLIAIVNSYVDFTLDDALDALKVGKDG